MNKVTFDEFSEKLIEVTSSMCDDEKLDLYEELLETGSTETGDNFLKHTFSIVNGFEHDCIFLEKYDRSDQHETIDEIDAIVNSDVDEDPIDFELLELESNEIDDDGRELTEQEIMEIGYNPWTNEKVNLNSLIETCDRYIVVIKEMLDEYSKKEGFEYAVKIQREKLVEFNLMKTIIKFYYDKTKLQASDGELK